MIINTNEPAPKLHSPAPLTPPPRLSNHTDHGTERTFAIPPSKPVPPPPRQKHIEKEYNNLVASGRLGSQDSLKAVSTECLTSLGRSPRRRGSAKRRNSEEINKSNFEGVVRRSHDPTKLNRARPKSFQAPDTPKTPFLCLANRYQTSIKPAFSLPSLVGDQVKLSPDDDRPFLDPIPRRNKSRSLLISDSTAEGMFPERNCSSMKDLSVAGTADSSSALLWTKRFRAGGGGSVEDISRHHRDSLCSNSTTSLSSSLNDVNVLKKPLPPEPHQHENHSSHLGSNSMMAQLLASKITRPPLIAAAAVSPKPMVPPRSSSKNNTAKKMIEDQRSRQTGGSSSNSPSVGLLSDHYHRAPPFIYGRLRPHISFESINEESEQASTPKDEVAKLPGGVGVGGELHDHRRSRSEPHERILQDNKKTETTRSFTLSAQKLNEPNGIDTDSENDDTDGSGDDEEEHNDEHICGPENKDKLPTVVAETTALAEDVIFRQASEKGEKSVRTLTYDSRASSIQSLVSVASSVRSTTSSSSKHEQQNLRRAIMNVHGQGPHDLSYEAGAVLYECRPKNKHGLCYGILDNSTEGWFPAESVESFSNDQQL